MIFAQILNQFYVFLSLDINYLQTKKKNKKKKRNKKPKKDKTKDKKQNKQKQSWYHFQHRDSDATSSLKDNNSVIF